MWDMRTKNTLCFNTKWFVTIILKTMHKNFEYKIACERQHETMCTEQNRANEQSFPTTWMQPCFFFLFVLFYLSVCVVVQLCRNFLYFMSDFISGTFLQIQLSGRICHVSCFSFQLEQRQRYKQNNIQIYINH